MQLFDLFRASAQDKREVLNMETFGDPLAMETEWCPLVIGGSSACTHRVVHRHGTVVVRPSLTLTMFCGLLIAIGVTAPFILPEILMDQQADTTRSMHTLAPLIFFLFVPIGVSLLQWGTRKIMIFNKAKGILERRDTCCDINTVYAIQILREHCVTDANEGGVADYFSYEINLVLNTGERINVVDHGFLRFIRRDARLLAKYLEVPLWDAIDLKIPNRLIKM